MLAALLPLQVVAAVSTATAPPVEVTLYDGNHKETYVVTIGRDGSVDDDTRDVLEHAFRCRRSEREHGIDRGLLAMIADVSAHFDGATIEYISAYRGHRKERKTSPHLAGRAFDFRVQGVKLTEVRDYAWANFQEVGVGWYPQREFVHIDHRPGEKDISWTEKRGRNHYHPSWAKRVRDRAHDRTKTRSREDRVGL
jgi:uncharacterized protein YcbK (DUF882 family)